MNRVLGYAAAGMLAAMTGCATPPERIKAAPATAGKYDAMSCQQLASERSRVETRLAELSRRQTKAANDDVGAYLVGGLLLASAVGEDHKSEIAVLKGDQAAIAQASGAKACTT